MTVKIESFGVYRDSLDPNADLPLVLAKQASTVEACLKTRFGYQLTISGLPPGGTETFRKVVSYPVMHKPDGSISIGYERAQTVAVRSDGTVSTHQGYGLDYDYEAVLGKWKIEFWYGPRQLASKTFTLVPCKSP